MNSRTAAIWLFSEMNSNEDALRIGGLVLGQPVLL